MQRRVGLDAQYQAAQQGCGHVVGVTFDFSRPLEQFVVVQAEIEGVVGRRQPADDGAGGAAQAALGRNLARCPQSVWAGRGRRQRSEGAKSQVAPGVAGHVLEKLAVRLDNVASGGLELVLVAEIDGEPEHIESGAQVAGGRRDGYASATAHRPGQPPGRADVSEPRTTCIDCWRKGAAARCE